MYTGEVRYLGKIFSRVPTMGVFIDTLRDRYCMSDTSFTELEYRERLGGLLEHAPNLTAVRLNLPFQLISRHCRAATMILGNTIEALARRPPEESAPLRTLVVENLTDSTIVKLWHNPRDVKNIIDAFSALEHLVLSVRRHEDAPSHTVTFRSRLWEMIGKAPGLRSLCLVGLDIDEKHLPTAQSASCTSSSSSSTASPQAQDPRPALIRTTTQRDLTLEEWQFRSVPSIRRPPKTVLPHLACLELRRVEVIPGDLIDMFEYFQASLQELYLDHVYLKKVPDFDEDQGIPLSLWVGLPNVTPVFRHSWIAVRFRQMRNRLRVCRASNLGYDQYFRDVGAGTEAVSETGSHDLQDPCGLGRSLEQRFVEVVLGHHQPPAPDGSPVDYLPADPATQPWALADREAVTVVPPRPTRNSHDDNSDGIINSIPEKVSRKGKERIDESSQAKGSEANESLTPAPGQCQCPRHQWWSVEQCLEGTPYPRNPTSGWTRHGIDGRFANCNPFTLHELQHIADTALEGMSLVQMLDCEGQIGDHGHGVGVGGDGNGDSGDEDGDGDGLAGLRSVMFAAGVMDDGEEAGGS